MKQWAESKWLESRVRPLSRCWQEVGESDADLEAMAAGFIYTHLCRPQTAIEIHEAEEKATD